jgi:hypothetical protein
MHRMFTVCATAIAILAASAIASPRAGAMTSNLPADLRAAIHETSGEQYVTQVAYRGCGYYWFVCRAWWAACGWEGPYFLRPNGRYVYMCR